MTIIPVFQKVKDLERQLDKYQSMDMYQSISEQTKKAEELESKIKQQIQDIEQHKAQLWVEIVSALFLRTFKLHLLYTFCVHCIHPETRCPCSTLIVHFYWALKIINVWKIDPAYFADCYTHVYELTWSIKEQVNCRDLPTRAYHTSIFAW